MSVDTNAVHESIKLALDAADAATDVTTEYNRVKRDHRNLEASVKQIHRYTTIIFSVSIGSLMLLSSLLLIPFPSYGVAEVAYIFLVFFWNIIMWLQQQKLISM